MFEEHLDLECIYAVLLFILLMFHIMCLVC